MVNHVDVTDNVRPARAIREVPKNRFRRFAHVDALRAFAVLLVVIEHSGITISPGDSGVTVFFTISGFIITALLLNEWNSVNRFDIVRFYRRRFLKLAPPFVITMLIPGLVWGLLVPHPPIGVMLTQVFFSYNWAMVFATRASQETMPGSGVLWSLGVEEQFYIAFAVLWLMALHCRRPLMVTAFAAAGAIVVAHVLRVYYLAEDFPRDWALRSTPARMDAIAWGVLLAIGLHVVQQGRLSGLRRLADDRLLVLAVLLYPLLAVPQWPWWEKLMRPGLYPLIACQVILYGMLARESPLRRVFDFVCGNRAVTGLGVSSYSVYLAHGVVAALLLLLAPQMNALPLAVRSPLLAFAGIAAGFILYLLVEIPVLRLRAGRGW